MIKTKPINKMLCRALIIALMIVNCCARHRDQRSNNTLQPRDIIEEELEFSDIGTDSGETYVKLKCPLEELISVHDNLFVNDSDIEEQRALINKKIILKWLKDDLLFLKRDNGNHYEFKDRELVLFQTGESDSGKYTCEIDYSNVTRNFTRLFKFYRSGSFRFQVIDGLPNLRPAITHPPSNEVVKRGTNVTFTCNRADTLSHQTTYWFKSCAFTNKTCIDLFKSTFDKAVELDNFRILDLFTIQDCHDDTLTVTNVSDDSIGLYACAVVNQRGADIRYAKLELLENVINIEQELRIDELHRRDWLWFCFGTLAFITVSVLIAGFVYFMKLSILRDKKQNQQRQNDPLIVRDPEINSTSHKDSNLRQHLPSLGCPNIYNISKSANGCITGHLQQDNGHILAQSICSHILDKENPSISSSNSQNSDEASSSWGKSLCSQGDNCRNFYLHTSSTTATTIPMYDHPPSNGTMRHYKALVQDSCVINPTYGFLRPENDATDWSFPRRNLDRLDKIGEGQFGEVWRYVARQKDGHDDIVAVKQLKHRIGLGDRERLELIAEIEIMKSVNNHPNVIKLLHYCIDKYEPILLIMEYAEHGKLQTYLRDCRSSNKQYGCISEAQRNSITSKELIKFTYHIAKGMEYVASQGIVHRDLASRNILVTKEKVCKVADFGFARRVNEDCAYERTTTNPVPVKWMAPEALVENKFTSKSDVFSLGILMWEIVTLGATPYEQLSSEGVYKKVTTGGRLDRPAHCSDEFYNLMAQCWLHDSALRPTFKQVSFELEKLLLSGNDYIKLDQYPEHAYYNIITKEEKEVVNIET